MRCPRMQGFPKQTFLSIDIRERSSCLLIFSFMGTSIAKGCLATR